MARLIINPDFVRSIHTWNRVELTTKQKRDWDETRARFLYQCPAFSYVFYEMMPHGPRKELALFTRDLCIKRNDADYHPPAATDGAHILINPEEFFSFAIDERLFILAHEVGHGIFNHVELGHVLRLRGEVRYPDGYVIPFIEEVFQIACDAVLNDLLVKAGTGKFPTRDGKPFGVLMQHLITSAMDVVTAYRTLYDLIEKNGGGGGAGGTTGNGKGGTQGGNIELEVFDVLLTAGSTTGQEEQTAHTARNDGQWQTAIASAIAVSKSTAAKGQGQDAAELERMFGKELEVKPRWQDAVKGFFARKVGYGALDWQRGDRRLLVRDLCGLGESVFAPGRSGHAVGTVVIAGDTSGSITDGIVDLWFAELASILEELRPRRLVIMWGDTHVKRVDEAEDSGDLNILRYKGVPGGGGTDFRPFFREVMDMGLEPDAMIMLTDTHGTFPAIAPTYPLLIGSITPRERAKVPFGDFVYIDPNEK